MIQRGTKETGRVKGSLSRSQREICGLTLDAMEVSSAVNEDHCFPTFVVLGNTWIATEVSASQSGCVYGFLYRKQSAPFPKSHLQTNFQRLPATQALSSNNLGYVTMWPLWDLVSDQRIQPLGYHRSNKQIQLCRKPSTAPAWDLQPSPCPVLLGKRVTPFFSVLFR